MGDDSDMLAEAARLLNLSLRAVQSAVERERLLGEKCGGRWRVPITEVERYRTFHLHAQDGAIPPNGILHREAHGGGWRPKGSTNPARM